MSSDDIITTGVAIDTTGIDRGIERLDALASTGPKVDKALQSVEQSAAKTGKSLATLGQGSGAGLQDAAQKVDQSSKSIAQSIQRTADAAEASGKAHKEASKSIEGIGVSAAQTAAAMRQLPSQFSDIVSSIQGGQKPLSVFLQQGSQIKDAFGGAGAAAKAMAGYIAGLVSPFSIAAAAAAGLGVAAYKGAKEAEEFRKSLILTGNAAGVTAGQLITMSEAVKSMGGGTQGKAAEILNQLASSGLVGANSLAKFADAALRMQKVGGPAAEETAAAFEALGRTPAAAAAKLNESTNFLTRSLYLQIKALEDQGRTVDAARLAQEAYADSLNQRSPEVLKNLGLFERAWLGIKDATANALDALKSIGREDSLEKQLERLKTLRENKASSLGALAGTGAEQVLQSEIAAIDKEVALLSKRLAVTNDIAAAEGLKNEKTKAGIKWAEDANKYLSDQETLQREIVRLQNEGNAAGAEAVEIAKRIAVIRQQYDSGAGLEAIRRAENERQEQIKRGLDAINTLRNTGYINERTQIEEITRLDLASLDAKRASLVAELGYQSKRINAGKEVEALKTQIAAVDQQRLTRQALGTNQVVEALERQKRAIDAVNDAQRDEYEADWNRALVEQSKAREAIQISLFEYNQKLKDEAEQMRLEVELMGQSNVVRNTRLAQFRIELELRKQLDAINNTHYEGGEPERELARQQARANAAKAAAQAETRAYLDEWQKTADKISDTLTDALLRGFESGKGFAENLRDTVVNMFKTMVLRPVVSPDF
jgi:phage-related minor tail protein